MSSVGIISCTDVPRYHLPELIADALQGAFSKDHHIVINLDDVEPESLFAATSYTGELESDLFIGRSFNITLSGDSLYVADEKRSGILIGHKNADHFTRSFGSPGEGPNEFGAVVGIHSNGSQFFFVDRARQSIHVYSRDLKFVATVPNSPLAWMNVASNQKYLFASASFSSDSTFTSSHETDPF